MKNIKKNIRLALMSTAIAAGMAVAAGGAAFAAEYKLNSWLGPTHPLNTGGYVPFIDAVKKDSNGEIDFKLFLRCV